MSNPPPSTLRSWWKRKRARDTQSSFEKTPESAETSQIGKPGWVYWGVVALLVIMLYGLSLGPAYWLAYRMNAAPYVWATLETVYSPIDLATEYTPQSVNQAIDWYVSAGCRP